MKNEQEIRELLIQNTIRIVSEGGFEKATTKAIAHSGQKLDTVKMNEVYIYRIFGGKEHLYEAAFEFLDKELVNALSKYIHLIQSFHGTAEEQLHELFSRIWHFTMKNEAACRYYIRYYYSTYFVGRSLTNHHLRFDKIVIEFAPLFVENADVRSIMHSVLSAMLDFAVRVFNGELKNNSENELYIFQTMYCLMKNYLISDNC